MMPSTIVPSDDLPQGPISNDAPHKRFFSIAPPAALIFFFVLIFVAGAIVTVDRKENLSILQLHPREAFATEEIRPPATSASRAEPTEEPNLWEVKSISICCFLLFMTI